MILKLIILGAIAYGIYRLMGGKILPQKDSKNKNDDIKKLPDDTMVECETCSTFVSVSEAIQYKGKYYCSPECLNKKGE